MTNCEFMKRFNAVSLTELDQLSLMSRTDTKFVFHERLLEEFLSMLVADYKVLEVNGKRISPYHSTYFDSPAFHLYCDHHNGRRSRYKVRLRDYLISDISFFEIKKKTNKNRTKKKRITVPYRMQEISSECSEFLSKHTNIEGNTLVKTLENSFDRITLAGFETFERVTVDLNVSYSRDGQTTTFPGLVIAEVKRGSGSRRSPVTEALHSLGVFPGSFSKYCMGMVSMVPQIRYNNFKPKLLKIKKILS